jgi:hypothetical protein
MTDKKLITINEFLVLSAMADGYGPGGWDHYDDNRINESVTRPDIEGILSWDSARVEGLISSLKIKGWLEEDSFPDDSLFSLTEEGFDRIIKEQRMEEGS